MDPVVSYDKEADILAIELGDSDIMNENLLDSDIVLGYDERGRVIYIEVWDASKRNIEEILEVVRNNIPITEKRHIVEKLVIEILAYKNNSVGDRLMPGHRNNPV